MFNIYIILNRIHLNPFFCKIVISIEYQFFELITIPITNTELCDKKQITPVNLYKSTGVI